MEQQNDLATIGGLKLSEKEDDSKREEFDLNRNNEQSSNGSRMDNLMGQSQRNNVELPDDLACFLQQQKQRQARLETTMRSFPSSSSEVDVEKQDFAIKRKRTTHEDPMSHRIIEKRRRDRMNNCLADLSRLIPSSYLKKGRGRIEKTEIIEMAIKHMKHLQNHSCSNPDGCEVLNEIEAGLTKTNSVESFRVGYHECLTETMHFLVETEGLYSGDAFCVRMMGHLQKHYDRLGRASTSEIHSQVGRPWTGPGLPAERSSCSRERRVKSEYGLGSDDGYSSIKADTESESVVNFAKKEDPEVARRYKKTHSHSPDPIERIRRFTEDRVDLEQGDDQPSDLSIGSGDVEQSSSRYKFKSNIRQRFDMQDEVREKRARVDSGGGGFVDIEQTGLLQSPSGHHRSRFEEGHGSRMTDDLFLHPPERKICTSPTPHPPVPPPSSSGYPLPKPQSVPIFALNPKGTFYVPLSIDLSTIAPFMNLFNDPPSGPLHPVTISVNFRPSPVLQPPPPPPHSDWTGIPARQQGVIQQAGSVIKHWRDAP